MKSCKDLTSLLIAFLILISFACTTEKKGNQEDMETNTSESVDVEEDKGSTETLVIAEGQLTPEERFDDIIHGVRVIISYNPVTSTFEGTIENISEVIIRKVRVEVHLSSGIELGPTDPIDLDLGDVREISLDASGQEFESWTAHSESGK